MDLFQVDDEGQLFISPVIENWDALAEYGIDTVIDSGRNATSGAFTDWVPVSARAVNACPVA